MPKGLNQIEMPDTRNARQIPTATSISRIGSPRSCSSTIKVNSRMAVLIFSMASASMAPRDQQPGKPRTEMENPLPDSY